MTGPAPSWNTVPVTGRFLNLDASPCVGSLIWAVGFDVVSVTNDIVFPGGGQLVTPLDNTGAFSSALPASDDPDNLPTTFQYKVTRRLSGYADKTVYVSVPLAAAGTGIDMSQIFSVADVAAFAPSALLRGVAGGVAALRIDGKVTNADGSLPGGLPAGHFALKIDATTGIPYIDTTGA